MKTVFVADSPAQAHLVMGLLEEAGIRCVVEGEMLFGARGDLGMSSSTLPGVCVADEDVQRASDLIRSRRHPSADTGVPPPIDDELPERPGMRWFKAFLLVWVIAWLVGLAVAIVIAEAALAICAAVGLAAALVWMALGPRR